MINNTFGTNTLRLAVVTQVYPEGQKLEVMFLDTGDYGRDVQVMTPYAGTDFGFTSGIPAPGEEGHDPNKEIDPDKRHIVAVIATLQGRHICMGFLFPQVTHMAFTKDSDKNRMIERHTSDFYRTTDDNGNMDMVHPSGAYIRIGEGHDATTLESRDYDNRWKISRNRKKDVSITLGNNRKSKYGRSTQISLNPDGSISISATRGINITGTVKVTGSLKTTGNLESGTGATGTFATESGTLVQVRNGVITTII